MNKIAKSLKIITGLLICLTACQNSTENIDLAQEEAAVKKIIDLRYQGLNEMFTGDISTIKSIWSHADDVTVLNPIAGIKVGWSEVLADWEYQASLKLGGSVKPSNIHMVVGKEMAVVVNEETGTNNNTAGNPLEVHLRATHVLRKENGEWKIISEHLDKLPFLE